LRERIKFGCLALPNKHQGRNLLGRLRPLKALWSLRVYFAP
jgi:hypothetical protein